MVETKESAASSLNENFQRYFTTEFAALPELKAKVYNVRYRVYCEEFGYEPLEDFKDEKQEYDTYDKNSLHCLITHKKSSIPAGCVRMVPAVGDIRSDPLPFEKFCPDSLDWGFIQGLGLDRNSVCEISRLAVDGAFRRRSGESLTRFGEMDAMDCSRQEQRTFSLIAVACFLAATALTSLTGRTNVFAMMEPFLPRLLKRSGIHFQRAGKDVDYHGIRAPYFIRTQTALDGMRPELKELYDAVYVQINQEYSRLR